MKKGFSLAELLVSLGIVVLLAGAGIATTLRSNEQKKITEAAETVRQAVVQAKSMVAAGKKDCGLCGATGGVCGNGDNPLLGWRVAVTVSPVTYELHGECATVAAPTPTPYYSSGVKTLPTRVTLTPSGAVNILFYPLNKGTNLAAPTTFVFSSTMAGLTTKRFTISTQGEVSAIQ